jgi:hypothetical protein
MNTRTGRACFAFEERTRPDLLSGATREGNVTEDRTARQGTDAWPSKEGRRVRAALNMPPSPLFLPRDDPDLFLFLVRNKAVSPVVEHFFGWRLYVDRHVARLIKERQYNDRLRISQRDLFDLRRRDECFLFAILLEFHEEELRRQNVSPDDDRHLRFLLADFVAFALRRFREEMRRRVRRSSGSSRPYGPSFFNSTGTVLCAWWTIDAPKRARSFPRAWRSMPFMSSFPASVVTTLPKRDGKL